MCPSAGIKPAYCLSGKSVVSQVYLHRSATEVHTAKQGSITLYSFQRNETHQKSVQLKRMNFMSLAHADSFLPLNYL